MSGATILPMLVEKNVPLQPWNTFGIVARAHQLVRVRSEADIQALMTSPSIVTLPKFVLGGGSNIVITGDVKPLVLKVEIMGRRLVETTPKAWVVEAGAGENWHAFVEWTLQQGFPGLESLALIPGTVGASPVQNIGAYGVELKDTFDSLDALKVDDGSVVTFRKEQCHFGYRESFFKREGKDRFVILNVTFKLSKRPVLNTSYGNIGQELAKRGITAPTLRDVSDAVIAIRSSKLPDPKVIGNAGSFFKNPVVPVAIADAIRTEYPDVAAYPAGEGYVKLAAGWLIEKAGWKGFREDGFGVHKDQALVLVNHGGATGRNIFDLSTRILASIHERFGVELEREVNII